MKVSLEKNCKLTGKNCLEEAFVGHKTHNVIMVL